ncbi:Uncharacterized protein Fot_55931 [Forsythia ovata]|uniref:Uncharacterized protein n=1 Tax=Forsythia ovata TaxID=205694 RepID=A0ABD1P2H2_9LAMI
MYGLEKDAINKISLIFPFGKKESEILQLRLSHGFPELPRLIPDVAAKANRVTKEFKKEVAGVTPWATVSTPVVYKNLFAALSACIVGDVLVGLGWSIWYGRVLGGSL